MTSGLTTIPSLGRPSADALDSKQQSHAKNASATISNGFNPLPSKITSVLSTSFSDAEFREALSILDARAITNDAKTRRQIRLDLHKDMMDCNGVIIDRFGCISEQLRRIKLKLDEMNTEYDAMKSQASVARMKTSTIINEAASLLEERELVSAKQIALTTLQDKFIMTEDEISALTSTAEPVDDKFFRALSKAKTINQDCQIILGLEKQIFGLDLMERTSKYLNFGFQKLFQWIRREFKTLDIENPQIGSSIRQALRTLAERPTLFQNCLDFFSEARERVLSEAFHVALTGAATSGTEHHSVKPIDLVAHDTLRYAGDMLAWAHSAAVSEREALEVLFVSEGEELAKGVQVGRMSEVWRLIADEDRQGPREFNAIRALGDLVDKTMSGTASRLRQRIEQVIQTNEETILAYKLASLLNFYRVTFEKLLGPSSTLLECMQSLEAEALRQFRALIKDNIAVIHNDSEHFSADLASPAFLNAALDQLSVIMKTYDSSLSSNKRLENEFEGVMADAYEPYLLICENHAKLMSPLDASIFTINFNLAAEKCLAVFSFTKLRSEQVRSVINREAAKLVDRQYDFFRLESGLEPEVLCRDSRGVTAFSPRMNREVLGRASQRLDEFLPSALMDAMDRIKYVGDADLARRITGDAAGRFCQDFERLEWELQRRDLESGADETTSLQSVFPRTSAEIRVLLS